MTQSNFRNLILSLFILFSTVASAQQKDDSSALKIVLGKLEMQYEISFSYLDENVEGLRVDSCSDTLSLAANIQKIENQTDLVFRQLDERFYSISKKSNTAVRYCGYLIDEESNEPLVGVVVIANDLRTVSDNQGYFELKNLSVETNEEITFRHVGYETLNASGSGYSTSPCITLALTPSVSTLEEVVVYNYITQGIEKKVSGEYVVHNPQLQLLPGLIDADVMLSLQVLPGVHSAVESVSDINIRGGTNDQNLILWDGIRMYQSGHFYGLISIFNPYFTEKVTLTKNGTSAKFGDAVSGTIDIRTREEIEDDFSVSGGFNLLSADVSTQIPLSKKMAIDISARRSIANLLQSPTYDQYFNRAFGDIEVANYNTADSLTGEVEDFHYYDIGFKFLYDLTKNDKFRLSLLNVVNDLNYQEKNRFNDDLTKTSSLIQQSTAAGLSYQRDWNERVSTSLNGHLSYYQLAAENVDISNGQQLNQENEMLDLGVQFDANIKLNKNFDLLLGYHFDEIGATNLDKLNNPEFERLIKEVLHTHVLFAEGNYSSDSKKLDVRGGVRSNYYSQLSEINLEPRLVFNYRLTDKLSVDLAGELKSQTTAQIIDLQNDFLGVEKRRWVLSNNDDIPITKSKQVSLGMQYAHHHFLISLEGYRKMVDGIITSSQAFQNQFEFIRSSGTYKALGMDFLLSYKNQGFSAWASYTISRNLNEFKELIDQEFPSNIDIRHFVTNGISFSSRHLECSLGFNWHTGSPFTAPSVDEPVVGGEINYQFPNSSNLDNYMRVDISAKYKFEIAKKVKTQVGFSIWNLTDHKNTINAYYVLDDAGEAVQVNQKALGFTPNVMLRVSF